MLNIIYVDLLDDYTLSNLTSLDNETQIEIPNNRLLRDIFKDDDFYQQLLNSAKYNYELFKNEENEKEEFKKQTREILNDLKTFPKEKFYSRFDTIYINGKIEDIIAYINNNPEVKKMRIGIIGDYDETIKSYQEACHHIDLIYEHTGVWVGVLAAESPIPLSKSEYYKVVKTINDIVNEVKSLNLSPLEVIMYVYDIVRNREYKEANADDTIFDSRSLASIILSDKIVCKGFVTLFNVILSHLDISASSFHLDDKNNSQDGHVESIVLVDDYKYNVHGIYYFDPTFECKKGDDYSFLNEYYYFLKTGAEERIICNQENLLPYFNILTFKELEREKEILPEILEQSDAFEYGLLRGINSFLRMLGEETIDSPIGLTKKQIIDVHFKIVEATNRIVHPNTFANLFTYVRALEYYVHPEIFPYNLESIQEATLTNSFRKIDIRDMWPLLKTLGFTQKEAIKVRTDDLCDKIVDEKRIEQVKLTRALRTMLNNNVFNKLK